MNADAPTAVLIHGMWMTPRSWDNRVDHYRDRGYHAIAPAWPALNWALAHSRTQEVASAAT